MPAKTPTKAFGTTPASDAPLGEGDGEGEVEDEAGIEGEVGAVVPAGRPSALSWLPLPAICQATRPASAADTTPITTSASSLPAHRRGAVGRADG
ncbi:hypothetical protein [Streptomyces sp. AB3(2024)]|uniref:hypothetical protein n=1 Tax=Streptomyces sp. AB3(2024) TaxID=3317321 RepID=UPI0035A2BD87